MSSAGGERESLANLYRTALMSGAQAAKLDARSDEAHAINEASLASFRALNGRADAIGLFSKNEYYEEVATTDTPYLMLPYAYAEVLGRQRTTRRLARMRVIADAEAQLKTFVKLVDHLKLLPEDEKKLFAKRGRFPFPDAGKRREAKIKQAQKEIELKQKVQALRERKNPSLTGQTFSNDLELIASLLPTKRRYERFARVGDDDEEDEEIHRELTEMMIRLCWARAHQSLADLHAEKDMLAKAPPEENEDAERAAYDARDKQKGKGKADGTWKLDGSRAGGPDGKGALMDAKGKPLRPFTITSARADLRSKVFRPDHRLPTMTIEEYLAEEEARGNIIYGGGAQSAEGLTSDEKLQLRTEYDGTLDADDAEAERIRKQEYWALYTEEHRRGSGNTMNRG